MALAANTAQCLGFCGILNLTVNILLYFLAGRPAGRKASACVVEDEHRREADIQGVPGGMDKTSGEYSLC